MSPRRRHAHSADVRAHLMDAALRVFARKGYDGASVRDIAAEAGLTAPLLYHYFPSKQALLQALFERSGALVMSAFAQAAAVPDPRERLAALLWISARIVREHQDFWRVSYGVRFQRAVLDDLAVGVAAQSALFVHLFTALFTELGQPAPHVRAHALFATLDGLFQHFVLDPDGYPLDDVISHVIAQALSPPQPPPMPPPAE